MRSFTTAVVVTTLLGGAALVGRARADDPQASYYPLEVGHHWRYQLILEVEGAKQTALHDRAVVKQTRVGDRDAFVVEDKVDDALVSTETLALEGNKVLLLATQQEGTVERVCDPPRVFLDFAQLDTVGAVWSWTSNDERESFVTTVIRESSVLDHQKRSQRAAVVTITGTLKSADGKHTATQERKLWLVRGTGVVREHAVYAPAGEHATTTDEVELEPNAAPAAPSPSP